MAETPKIVELSANMTGHGGIGTVDARATLSARFSGTGRTVEANSIFGEIDALSRVPEPGSSVLVLRVRDALRACPEVECDPIVGYRGRILPGVTPTREDLGPPPRSDAPANRYNKKGAPALYLCTKLEAVVRELPDSADVWVQRFSIPLADLCIADLRSPEARSDQLLAALMWLAELSGEQGHPTQNFSRLVASLVSETFDGMLVSGVRGDDNFLYSNIVMFAPGEAWRSWLSCEPPSRV